MKRSYYTLEVVCHKVNEKDKRLIKDENGFKLTDIISRPFVSDEGINSRNESNKIDLFSNVDIDSLSLPNDIDSFSLVLFKKTNYTSKQCSILVTDSSLELLRVGDNLFAYDTKCENSVLVPREEFSHELKKYAYYTKEYLRRKRLERLGKIQVIDSKELKDINYDLFGNIEIEQNREFSI